LPTKRSRAPTAPPGSSRAAPAFEAAPDPGAPPRACANDSGPTILVLEDEVLARRVVAEALAAEGFRVLEAGTGAEALELIESPESPDILFTDIRLPGDLDGWAVAERFREVSPAGGVIYATRYSPMEARHLRGSLFFAKPYWPADVVKAARELAAARRRG
jgi:CheY-like chemotaxis protein